MDGLQAGIFILVFIYGMIIGSFLNVCIYRIPKKESIVKVRSHCMSCGYQLKWYDLVPVFSWLVYRGKCRKCGAHICAQYPVIEAVNGIGYVLIFFVKGFDCVDSMVLSLLYCLLASALLVLAVIDWRTYEIPFGINVFIGILGLVRLIWDNTHWMDYVIGFFAVSTVLWLIIWLSKGRAMGGGDAKLMAAAGLLLGWKLIILAFLIGCIAGSVIHIIRMKLSDADHVLAMGPYLAVGIMIAALWGDSLIQMYLHMITG